MKIMYKSILLCMFFLFFLSINNFAIGGGNNDDNTKSNYVIPNIPTSGIKITFRAMTATEEASFVIELLGKYNWYKTNGYNISLPNHPLVEKVKSGGSLQANEINQFKADFINDIYNAGSYQAGLKKLDESQVDILSCLPVFIDYQNKWKTDKWDFKVFPEYTVRLTLYGPGGSYNSRTGTVTMLTSTTGDFKRGVNPGHTVVHEMTHMAIDEFIIKYKIQHWVKERIVDKFVSYHFRTVFPDYKMQHSGDKNIDPYLEHANSWGKLPYYISQFVSGSAAK